MADEDDEGEREGAASPSVLQTLGYFVAMIAIVVAAVAVSYWIAESQTPW